MKRRGTVDGCGKKVGVEKLVAGCLEMLPIGKYKAQQ